MKWVILVGLGGLVGAVLFLRSGESPSVREVDHSVPEYSPLRDLVTPLTGTKHVKRFDPYALADEFEIIY